AGISDVCGSGGIRNPGGNCLHASRPAKSVLQRSRSLAGSAGASIAADFRAGATRRGNPARGHLDHRHLPEPAPRLDRPQLLLAFVRPVVAGREAVLSYLQLLGLVAPETIVVITALVVLGLDLLILREQPLRHRFWMGAAFAAFGCVLAAAWLLFINSPTHPAGEVSGALPLLRGMFVDDGLVRLVKVALLGLTVFTIAISMESSFTGHVGEYLALILLATVGMMFLVSAEDILMIFISLELTSLSLYILTAFNKRNVKSAEAALKYFLFGGMSAAFTLFGLSLVYGLSGSTGLREIAAKLEQPALTRNIIPTVASSISARYSPTCPVKLDSIEIAMVKTVKPSSATLTNRTNPSSTNIPRSNGSAPETSPAGCVSELMNNNHAAASTPPNAAKAAPIQNRRRTGCSLRMSNSNPSTATAVMTTMFSVATRPSNCR